MATGVLCDGALADWLTQLAGATPFDNMKAHIFTNNHTPTNADVLGTYTEATFTGYAAVALSGWGAESTVAHVGSVAAAQIDFNITSGSQVIYGVYFTDNAVTKLYGAVIDPSAPVTLSSAGITDYLITPAVSLQSV